MKKSELIQLEIARLKARIRCLYAAVAYYELAGDRDMAEKTMKKIEWVDKDIEVHKESLRLLRELSLV
jgi:hypothetical protein